DRGPEEIVGERARLEEPMDSLLVGRRARREQDEENERHDCAPHAGEDSLFSAAMDPRMADDAVRLCQALLRIDTTNPPGNERAAAELLAAELVAAGLEPLLLDSAPGRGNVIARLRGTGALAPLLLTAHLDVVEAEAAAWAHSPFSGDIADGFLWGRGAVDM